MTLHGSMTDTELAIVALMGSLGLCIAGYCIAAIIAIAEVMVCGWVILEGIDKNAARGQIPNGTSDNAGKQ